MAQKQTETSLEALLHSPKTLFLVFHILAFAVVSQVAPDPYIDEIFHVPQAQAYCAGNFSYWNDKITTPPGLYFPPVR
jgi:hypothetical protein